MVFLSLEAQPFPIFKTGQTLSYDKDGDVVTDDSVKDDGYYQAGERRRHLRDEQHLVVVDHVTKLEWQDNYTAGGGNENRKTWDDANFYCEGLFLDENNDWRLPSKKELESIVDRQKRDPALAAVFEHVSSFSYWSSTLYDQNTSNSWYIDFNNGSSYRRPKVYEYNVRCVRGEEFDNLNFTRDATTQTVTDLVTNLQWQDDLNAETIDKRGYEAFEYCETLDMANQTDWRLPSQNEFFSIVDYSNSPAINDTFIHVNTTSSSTLGGYLSSTTDIFSTNRSWYVDFHDGFSHTQNKYNSGHIRCVRGGTLDNLKLKSLIKTGQTKSYDASGILVTDKSIKDDGLYQAGLNRSYTRNNTTEIVTDNTTKLKWQDDDADSELRKNWEDANSYCSTLNLNGVKGWRLPSKKELVSIIDRDEFSPAYSTDFTSFTSGMYWSATTYDYDTSKAWRIFFSNGTSNYWDKSSDAAYIRCVRGGEFDNLNFTPDSATDTVTDHVTDLQWQDNIEVTRSANHMSWTEGINYCETLDMADQTDWRLANEKELKSIADIVNNKFINSCYDAVIWSSTTDTHTRDNAWIVLETTGRESRSIKSAEFSVRCVRGGKFENEITIVPTIMYLLN